MKANLILGALGSLVTLAVVFEMLRRRRLREKYAVLWVVVAAVTLVIAVFPVTLTWTADMLGVKVPANLLFFGASMLLLVVSIQHSHDLGRLEDRTRALAEELALLRMKLDESRAGTPARQAPTTAPPVTEADGRSLPAEEHSTSA